MDCTKCRTSLLLLLLLRCSLVSLVVTTKGLSVTFQGIAHTVTCVNRVRAGVSGLLEVQACRHSIMYPCHSGE